MFCSVWCTSLALIRFIPKHFILSDAIIKLSSSFHFLNQAILVYRNTIDFFCFLFCVCLFAFSSAIPAAYGVSQARGRMGAVVTGLHHSSQQRWILNPLSKARD